jgi:copper chaperone NosL
MQKVPYIIGLVLLFLGALGCEIKPQPISYGSDGCQFCSMTIVDRLHAAQLVTKKGRAYKFDAIECMINYASDLDKDEVALFLCNHYTTPEELIDATEAVFLISNEIPSPMGANLTAFSSQTAIEQVFAEVGGKTYTWKELVRHLNKNQHVLSRR